MMRAGQQGLVYLPVELARFHSVALERVDDDLTPGGSDGRFAGCKFQQGCGRWAGVAAVKLRRTAS